MDKTLAEIAAIVGGELIGDGHQIISGVAGMEEAGARDITFVANPKYVPLCHQTKAAAIIVPKGMLISGKSVIQTDNPSLSFARVVALFTEPTPQLKGIHPTAIIAPDAVIGKNTALGPYVVIEGKSSIGDNTTVASGSYVGYGVSIGDDCYLHPRVTILNRTKLGHRVVIHSGTVVGSDGFGYEPVNGIHQKIPQVGIVVVEDDVEIGANVTIDRARFDKTVIGRGTKIDNLVQIAHNVVIGENCILVGQSGISGSTTFGKGVILAGQSGVTGHLKIGEGVIIAARSGVTKSIPPGITVSGFPAQPHAEAKKVNACVQRLPVHVKTIQALKQKIVELEKKMNNL